MTQPNDGADAPRIVRRFWSWHEKHPDVWTLFEKFTLQAVNAGERHFGAKLVWEQIRWEARVKTTLGHKFKLPNTPSWSPFYARLFEDLHPEHGDIFIKRKSMADNMFVNQRTDGKFWPEGGHGDE